MRRNKIAHLNVRIIESIIKLESDGDNTTRRNIRTVMTTLIGRPISEQPIAIGIRSMIAAGELKVDHMVARMGKATECLAVTDKGLKLLKDHENGIRC